jgi:hypothetical protein
MRSTEAMQNVVTTAKALSEARDRTNPSWSPIKERNAEKDYNDAVRLYTKPPFGVKKRRA